MQNLTERTLQSIVGLESDPEIKNMLRLVDEHFDLWTERLFPLLKGKKIACYPYVVRLLHESGHEVATVELVRKYISVIRARRGIPAKPYKAPLSVTPTVTPTQPKRVAHAVPTQAVAPSVAVAPPQIAVPGVTPVEVTDWRAEIIRLESENSSSPWTGADQWMWNYFEAIARSMGKTLPKDFMSVEKSVVNPIMIDCLDKLLAKRM